MAKSNGFVWGLLAGAAAAIGAVAILRVVDEKKKKETQDEFVEIQKILENE